MGPIKPESRMLDEVRRWRRDAYEERSRKAPAQNAEDDRRRAAALGLQVLDEPALVKPTKSPGKRAG